MRGRYLIHFGPLNLALRLVDGVLLGGFWKRAPATAPVLPAVPRFLVSQPGHLGDVVIATAVIEPLRRLYPGCHVGFLVSSWSAAVLKDHPSVDMVHVHDHALLNRARRWWARVARHRATRRQVIDEIRAQRYDAALELSFNFPNNIALLHAAGVPVRVGYTSGGGGPLLTHAVAWQHHPDWSVMRYHETLLQRLAAAAGPAPPVVRSLLPRPDAAAQTPFPPPGGRGYTVVHMGSGGARKEWPAPRWEELVDGLLAQGRQLVFTGAGPVESARVAAVVRNRARCEDLSSRLDWPGFVGTIASADLVVAVDSAAGHIAAAFDVPTVTIAHGMTDAALYRPQSVVNAAVRNVVPCLPCYRSRGCPSMDCIRGVTAADVLGAAAR